MNYWFSAMDTSGYWHLINLANVLDFKDNGKFIIVLLQTGREIKLNVSLEYVGQILDEFDEWQLQRNKQ